MEALDALSSAASIVRFLDFVLNLLTENGHYYWSSSGRTAELVNLPTIESDLSHLMSEVDAKAGHRATGIPTGGSWEEAFLRIYPECTTIAKNLKCSIQELDTQAIHKSFLFGPSQLAYGGFDSNKNKDSVHESAIIFATAIQSKFNTSQCKQKLVELRDRTMSESAKVLWEKSRRGVQELDHVLFSNKAEVVRSLHRLDIDNETLNQSFIQALDSKATRQDPLRRDFVSRTWSSEGISDDPESSEPAGYGASKLLDLEQYSRNLAAKIKNATKYKDSTTQWYATAIMNSLDFRGAKQREDAIPDAYKETFQWIFANDTEIGLRFTNWLAGPAKDVYWITGKPGAGKSTLVKFLTENPKTQHYLKFWASDRRLLRICYYFWGAGVSRLQRSPLGLLRALLFQCLKQMPSLCPRICPRRWALFKIFGHKAEKFNQEWAWGELLESFSILASIAGTEFYLALFIDGLDEFDGDHDSLIQFIKLFYCRPGIKILVSSRPENVFLDAFKESPSLRMEKFTAKDIEIYVRSELTHTEAYKDFKQANSSAAMRLEQGVVEKAKGVFLWVTVVVRALCEGLQDGNNMSELQSLLDSLPSDLSELYSKIWEKISPEYREDSSELFQIHNTSTTLLDVVVLHFAVMSMEQGIQESNKGLHGTYRDYIIRLMTRRLNSRTRGLLEISKVGEVDFLHRSVREWANTMWDIICSSSRPDFDSHLAILKGLSFESTNPSIWKSTDPGLTWEFWSKASICLFHASNVRDNDVNVKELEKAMDHLDTSLQDVLNSNRDSTNDFTLYRQISVTESRGQVLPHWSTTQYTMTPDSLKNTFLGLAAQFAVLPYVREKIMNNRGVLTKPDQDHLSVLSCAVFGFAHFCRPDIADNVERYWKSLTFETRFRLVELLVHKGALGSFNKGYKQKTSKLSETAAHKRHWNIEDELQKKLRYLRAVSNVNSKELEYYERVNTLFSRYRDETENQPQPKSRHKGNLVKRLFKYF